MKWILPVSLGVVWVIAIVAGMVSVMAFDTTPGKSAVTPASWPAHSPIRFRFGHIHLIMLAHPECPCTRASLRELEEIMARSRGKIDAYVLFYQPSQIPPDWGRENLAEAARAIPGVTVMADVEGAEAARFGAVTSGHTVVYDYEGNLRFSGGITKARGQYGNNDGRKSVLAVLDETMKSLAQTPVYGCPLSARHAGNEKEGAFCEK